MKRYGFPLVVLLLVALPLIAHESKKYKLKIGDQTLIVELEELHAPAPPVPEPKPEPPPHPDPKPEPHPSHGTEVTDTHILSSHDKVPRFAAGAEAVAIKSGNWSDASTWRKPPAGSSVQIPAGIRVVYDVRGESVNALEIGGTLSFSDKVDTELWASEITVLPSGTLDIQPGEKRAEIVFPDGKLRADDPTEIGRGLLVFGALNIQGKAQAKTFSRLVGDVAAGAKVVSLRDSVDWPVGSQVVFPDTRQINPVSNSRYTYLPQQEVRSVAAVSGSTVTLESPLEFAHRSPRNMDGSPTIGFDGVPLAPHVACLSRSVVFRSENPAGVRGHIQCFGDAHVSIKHAELRDLGRTQVGPLGDANKMGRYSLHCHHLHGRPSGIGGYQFVIEGCSVVGALKWGITVHGSHYGLIKGNVVYDVDGAAIATETGSEKGNCFEGNFICKVGTEATPKAWNGLGEQTEGDLGDQGDGFWFAGPMNSVRNNVVANAQRSAYTVWPDGMPHHPDSRAIKPVTAPVSPLGDLKTFNLLAEALEDFQGNEAYGATTSAIQLWTVGDRRQFPDGNLNTLRNTTAWHMSGIGIRYYYADAYRIDGWLGRGDVHMLGAKQEEGGADYPSRGEGMTHSGSVARWSSACRVDIQGCDYGYIQRGHGFTSSVELCDCVLDNPTNIEILSWAQQPSRSVYQNILFRDSYSPGSLRAIRMRWEPFSIANAITPETHTVKDFQQIKGLDLDLYFHEQSPASRASMVPEGEKPKGRFAPTRIIDGDDGQAAAARGKAMGIDALVFVLVKPPGPLVFSNVLLDAEGKPRLYYAVLSGEPKVKVTFGGKSTELPGATGSLPLDAAPGVQPLQVESNGLRSVANVVFPIKR